MNNRKRRRWQLKPADEVLSLLHDDITILHEFSANLVGLQKAMLDFFINKFLNKEKDIPEKEVITEYRQQLKKILGREYEEKSTSQSRKRVRENWQGPIFVINDKLGSNEGTKYFFIGRKIQEGKRYWKLAITSDNVTKKDGLFRTKDGKIFIIKKDNSVELDDNLIMSNRQDGNTLYTNQKRYTTSSFGGKDPFYGYERSIILSVTICNLSDSLISIVNGLLIDTSAQYTIDVHPKTYRAIFLQLINDKPLAMGALIEPQNYKSFGAIICRFNWEETDISKPDDFGKYGPPSIINKFPDQMKYSRNDLKTIFTTLTKNNYEIFNGLKIQILFKSNFDLDPKIKGKAGATYRTNVIIYDNNLRFIDTIKIDNGNMQIES